MKKNFIRRSLSSKKFRYGGYATLLILGVLALVIALNLMVDQIPWKADLTKNQLYTPSEQTIQILKGLKNDVSLTMLTKVGQENAIVVETLSKYARASSHIKLATIDPERNPTWAKPYEKEGVSLSDGGIVVASADGKRFKSIQYYDIYNWDSSDYTQQPQASSLAIEQKVTTAILYVTAERNPTIYALKGHNEEALSDYAISSAIENQNYEVKDLTLLTSPSVPEDADVILIMDPKIDLSAQDTAKIQEYLRKGGRLFVLVNLPNPPSSRMPNLDGLLSDYGLAMRNVLVVEGNPENVLANNPLYFMPKQETHDILAPITKAELPILLVVSGGIDALEMKRRTLTVSPLLSTSMNSWGMVDYTTRQSPAKAKGDAEGPFTVAAAVVDQPSDPAQKDARLVVVASTSFLLKEFTNSIPGNADFFLNSLSWLRDKKDTISIQPKSLMTYRLNLNATQSWVLAVVTAILIPLLVLGAGLLVWLRRRHK